MPKYFNIRWKDCEMVTCCHDVGIYKNPKIIEYFEINVGPILRMDETMIESYDESNNLKTKINASVNDFLKQISLLSPNDDDKHIQYDDDE